MQHFNVNLSRRSLLKAAGRSVALPPLLATTAAAQRSQSSNPVFYRLGSFQAISITDGILKVPAALFVTNTSPTIRAGTRQLSVRVTHIHCNILFVDTGRNKVLIDTGVEFVRTNCWRLQANLKMLGIRPRNWHSYHHSRPRRSYWRCYWCSQKASFPKCYLSLRLKPISGQIRR